MISHSSAESVIGKVFFSGAPPEAEVSGSIRRAGSRENTVLEVGDRQKVGNKVRVEGIMREDTERASERAEIQGRVSGRTSEMDLEALAERVTERLWLLRLDQVKEVCDGNKVPTGNVLTKRALIKKCTESIDAVIDNEEEEVAKRYMCSLLSFIEAQIEREKEENLGGHTHVTDLSQAENDVANELDLHQSYPEGHAVNTVMEKIKRNESEAGLNRPIEQQPFIGLAPEVTVRRDFKICGQIGESGQKDKLSYTNLMHQVDRGLRKGHGEAEIIEAVIKAISPGLSLRNMLEIKRDLTLSQLKIILKGHFKEDSSTDLYYKLVNITQNANESPQAFLFRAIELKEKLLCSCEEGGEYFSTEHIQKKFLRSVGTGLISDHIKFQLRPYLDDSKFSDEMLINKMNEAAGDEIEKLNKQKKNTG
ncbi:hypothetical protein QTP70_002191 [Hemibagrus guttatus]|uniref:Uncharacterized protein n=1 Tax=Hemibagrus guttatus TaxID=175788 RepID=A0AAE0UGV2_9TELE|nr:hypothetical protein QTP70_002191 [Hemibagrus guttatus]